MRRIAIVAIAALVGILLAFIPTNYAPPALAAIVSPNAPNPLNILPSTTRPMYTGVTAPQSQQALIHYLYQASKDPMFWRAAAAQQAGNATGTQLQLVQQTTDSFRVPASTTSKLIRGAGAAGVVLFGAEVGTMMGNGALELFGFDVDGTVCPNVGSDPIGAFAEWITKADCSQFPDFDPNTDLTPAPASELFCGVSAHGGWCLSLVGVMEVSGSQRFVFIIHEGVAGGLNAFEMVRDNGTHIGTSFTMPGNCNGSRPGSFAGQLYDACNAAGGDQYSSYFADVVGFRDAGATTVTPIEADYPDPERFVRCKIEGSDDITYTQDSAPYFESSGVMPEILCPQLPDGVWPETTIVEQVGGGLTHELFREDASPEFQNFIDTVPECMEGTCLLDLRLEGQSCFQNPTSCADWFADPDKASKYSCHYGTEAVDLAECTVYAPSFVGNPAVTGNVYGDPETGLPLQSPAPSGQDAGTFGAPVQNPESTRQCFPEGWGVFNPTEWVTKPVQCALEWAFVPRASALEAKMETLRTNFEASGPGQVASAVASVVPTVAPKGCEGIPYDLSWFATRAAANDVPSTGVPETVYLLAACEGDVLHPWAAAVNLILVGGIGFIGLRTTMTLLGRLVGYTGVDGT